MMGDDIPIEISVQTQEPVRQLELWSNGGVIRTLEGPPFRTTIRKAGPGGYRMHAVAHTAMRKITSPQIRISVLMSEEERMREPTAEDGAALTGGVEPKVFFDTPTPGTTLSAPADIVIEGWAVAPAAALKSITILGDGKPLAAFTTTPFKHVWRGVGRGRHNIAVQAVDAEGRTTVQSETVIVK